MKNMHDTNGSSAYIRNDLLRLIEIKENKNCWFQCLHSYSVFYKTPIQIINNQFIIDRLMPLEASMVGIVCGEIYKEFLRTEKNLSKPISAGLLKEKTYYKLLLISRDGSIEYETTSQERHLEKNIIDLIRKKEVVRCFSPSDAYYIGFLAGLELYKIKNNLKSDKLKKIPKLRLIKV